jgi:predicted nucleotidyltransferase
VSADADSRFRELLAYAEDDDGVLGLFVFGSRSREGFADESSDYDVGVVVREDSLEAFDARWPYEHGAPVEVASTTLAGLRDHAEPGTPSAWARYQYAHVELLVDKSGEVSAILAEKARLPDEHRLSIAADALDAYVNSTYRSLRDHDRGLHLAARLDAAESVPHLLTAIFAFDERVRPFNKYLEWELGCTPCASRLGRSRCSCPGSSGSLRETQKSNARCSERSSASPESAASTR